MTTADGRVLGVTKIVDSGSPRGRWNVVFLGDGYTDAQMTQFATDAKRAADTILDTAPFNMRRSVINAYRVDVTSIDSGADDPATCGGPGNVVRTFFDSAFCNNNIRRLLIANAETALTVADRLVPELDCVMVFVNSTEYGGSGGAIGVFSLAEGAPQIALHELGHSAFGLADEYDYYSGCTSGETGQDRHSDEEPDEPNVTIASTLSAVKWRHLIAATTPIPTTTNPNCAQCDRRPSPVAEGVIGLFEGAHYYHCGAYRPAYRCKMFDIFEPFCRVCQAHVLSRLPTTVPLVLEQGPDSATQLVRAAGLTPKFTGTPGRGAWVWRQSPRAGTVISAASIVSMQLRTGPIP